MKIDTNDMVSVSEASKNGVSWLIGEAGAGRNIVVLRNSRPAAVVVGPEVMDRLERVDELEEDLRLWALTLTRVATDTGERFDLDDVARQLGVDLTDEDDDDEE
jgi:PHD/YefM family antitoxin component YafN of YafNO toxin-antitoxin module